MMKILSKFRTSDKTQIWERSQYQIPNTPGMIYF